MQQSQLQGEEIGEGLMEDKGGTGGGAKWRDRVGEGLSQFEKGSRGGKGEGRT